MMRQVAHQVFRVARRIYQSYYGDSHSPFLSLRDGLERVALCSPKGHRGFVSTQKSAGARSPVRDLRPACRRKAKAGCPEGRPALLRGYELVGADVECTAGGA